MQVSCTAEDSSIRGAKKQCTFFFLGGTYRFKNLCPLKIVVSVVLGGASALEWILKQTENSKRPFRIWVKTELLSAPPGRGSPSLCYSYLFEKNVQHIDKNRGTTRGYLDDNLSELDVLKKTSQLKKTQ